MGKNMLISVFKNAYDNIWFVHTLGQHFTRAIFVQKIGAKNSKPKSK